MKNRFTALLICLVLLSLLFGCARSSFQNVENTSAATVSGTYKTVTATTSVSTTAPETTTDTIISTTAAKPNINVSAEQETEKNTTKKKKTKTTTKAPKTTAKVTTSTTTRSKTHCTITIQCREILSHRDRLKDGYEDYVPDSGYIVKNYSVKYENGDTVFTVLQRTCRENGIKMGAKATAFGMYVYSINYLPEKACGGTSGWTYYVDGNFPNVSVDNYPLHGGEAIEFRYVV